MFFTPQNSAEKVRQKQKMIKLVKFPIHLDWIEAHVKIGRTDRAYLVMLDTQSSDVKSPKIVFYTKGQQEEIESEQLLSLFSKIPPGWLRLAEPHECEYMKNEGPPLLKSFFATEEEKKHPKPRFKCSI